jgi:hypothetical protein
MRLVRKVDKDGWIRQAYVRDRDPDSAFESGIPHEPPDLKQVDWDEVARELHNLLTERNLIAWLDVQAQQNGLQNAIISVMKRKLVALYRE